MKRSRNGATARPHAFRRDVLAGLARGRKSIPCKYLYDEEGSRLFQRITRLPEYYPTRVERSILEERTPEMARAIGPRARVVEPGIGSPVKVSLLLEALEAPAAVVPVEICRERLAETARELTARFPALPVLPVAADFTREFPIPEPPERVDRTVVFFPGSTIGNFRPATRIDLLRRFAAIAGGDGGVLLGVDLVKETEVLLAAYDDASGVTAEFNRNLLLRMNRELGADFDPEGFEHRATWNPARSRVEMHLVSRGSQTVRVAGRRYVFARGEWIHTENSYKFTRAGLAAAAGSAGLAVAETWTDPRGWFLVAWLVRRGE